MNRTPIRRCKSAEIEEDPFSPIPKFCRFFVWKGNVDFKKKPKHFGKFEKKTQKIEKVQNILEPLKTAKKSVKFEKISKIK